MMDPHHHSSILPMSTGIEPNLPAMAHPRKRSYEERGELERLTKPKKKMRQRGVHFQESSNKVHVQPSNRKVFQDYDEGDIWYSVRRDFDASVHCLRMM